jgi:hypothetical protein
MPAKYRRELATSSYQVFLVGLAVMLVHLWGDRVVSRVVSRSRPARLNRKTAPVLRKVQYWAASSPVEFHNLESKGIGR